MSQSILSRMPIELIEHMKTFVPVYEVATLYITQDGRSNDGEDGEICDHTIVVKLTPAGDRISITNITGYNDITLNTTHEIIITRNSKVLAKCIQTMIKADHYTDMAIFMFTGSANIDEDYQIVEPGKIDLEECLEAESGRYENDEIASICELFGEISVQM